MSDIVERLRSWQGNLCHSGTPKAECWEAADEIERLRKLIDGAAETGEVYERRLSECEAENDALRQQLAEATELLARAEDDLGEWQRECEQTDLLLQGLGLCPSEYRSEGGSLLVGRIAHKLR